MPYDPTAIDIDNREFAYKYIWFSGACSIVYLFAAFLGWNNALLGVIWGGAAGGFLAGALAHTKDEYFQSMCLIGMRWLLVGLAVFVCVEVLVSTMDIAHSAGFALTNPDAEVRAPRFAIYFTDAKTLAALLGVLFHAGYFYAWFKQRSA